MSEGVIQSIGDINSLDIMHLDDGIELRMWLAPSKADRLNERRRRIAGPQGLRSMRYQTGSPEPGVRPAGSLGRVAGRFQQQQIMSALQAIPPLQKVNIETRAVHAAALWTPGAPYRRLARGCRRPQCARKLGGARWRVEGTGR